MNCFKKMAGAALLAALIPMGAMAAEGSTIEGSVDFTGKAPTMAKLHREADPFCAKKPMTDQAVLIKDKKLENVWVHLTKGVKDAGKAETSKKVEVSQKDCMYSPRMQVAQVGQTIVAKNDDPVLHNVHTYNGASTVFNKGMPNASATPIDYVAKEEGMMKWKCDVHPWMRGYVGVTKHPYSTTTGDSGDFKIENVPPGKYTIEAWHEKYGTKTQEVTVEAGKPAKVTFKYDGTEKGS